MNSDVIGIFSFSLCSVVGKNDCMNLFVVCLSISGDCGSAVVKVLRYKSEGRWFDSSWCQWIFH